MKRKVILVFISLILATPMGGSALAQQPYPGKPIRLVVPFTPGTGPDFIARALGQKLGDDWKTAVVVENRPGASGNIGAELVARAPADGYTLLLTASTFVQSPSLYKAIPYDPVRDFAPVAPLAIGRLALVTNPSLGAKTVAEFIALARAQPGALNYASPGNGTPHHLAMELLKSKTGINVVHIPYKGSAGAVSDLLGGRVVVMFLPVHVALPYVADGRLNMLAVGGMKRSDATPQTPSLAEATGIRDIDTDIWYALYAPSGTPRDVIAKLNLEVNTVLKSPEITEALGRQGLQPTGGTPEQLEQLTRADLARWTIIVREAGIHPD